MSVLQHGRHEAQAVPLVVMTHRASERSVQTALQEINQIPSVVSQPTTLIRVEDEEY